MTTGPEFQPGWRDEFVDRGRIIRIEARHYPRKRLPIYEWALVVGRVRMHTIRHLPGGFQVAGDRQVYRTLREAAISKI